MSYQALYRVWRSQTFDSIVGQKPIKQTLKNAILQKKTSHAYLFTGPRGTGKTSAAKIFAKAVNCHLSVDGEPCNKCETCLSITNGSSNDVIEIDAASNNGVEEIRDIREKVKYAPTEADYKVYIIDEVHMLSTGAFNALLKTLEEPPAHVIFILATTEPHKIPATIISRTQRFDFKRIATKDIVEHMAEILQQMAITYDEAALYAIARSAEGGMRDALSILDQAISFADGKVTEADAMQVTGSLSHAQMDQYLAACFAAETETALELLEAILDEGKEARRLLEDLLLYCRDLLMQQQAPQLLTERVGNLSDEFQKLAQEVPAESIYLCIENFNETQNQIRFTNSPNVYLEVVTVKITAAMRRTIALEPSTEAMQQVPQLVELEKQVQNLQKEVKRLSSGGATLATQTETKPASRPRSNGNSYRVPTERVFNVLQEATKDNLVQVKGAWEELLQILSVTQRALIKASEVVAAGPSQMVLAFDYEIVCQRVADNIDIVEAMQAALERLIQYHPDIICIPMENWGALRKQFIETRHTGTEEGTSAVDEERQAEVLLPSLQEDEKDQDQVVEQALSMFGEDFVQVEEN